MNIDALSRSISAMAEIDARDSPAEIVGALMNFLQDFGFRHLLITGLPQGFERWDSSILYDGWPAEWFERYAECGHFSHDPCAERSRNSAAPFFWRDLAGQPLPGRQLRVMQEAREFRMSDGVCVPVHQPSRKPAVVTVAGDAIQVGADDLPVLEMVCLHTFRSLLHLSGARKRPAHPALTSREREILSWTAAGKSAEDVACILGISRCTVERHLGNIRGKFDCSNTVHAVVLAVRDGEIHP